MAVLCNDEANGIGNLWLCMKRGRFFFLFSAVSAGWGWEWFRHPDTLIKKNSRLLKNAY